MTPPNSKTFIKTELDIVDENEGLHIKEEGQEDEGPKVTLNDDLTQLCDKLEPIQVVEITVRMMNLAIPKLDVKSVNREKWENPMAEIEEYQLGNSSVERLVSLCDKDIHEDNQRRRINNALIDFFELFLNLCGRVEASYTK